MSFGIFESLSDYGILGLGYLCWMFLNRLMKSEDDYKKRVEELEGEIRDEVSDAIKKNTDSAKTLKETILMLFSKK